MYPKVETIQASTENYTVTVTEGVSKEDLINEAQHGSPPGWLEESDPAGVILYVTAVQPDFSILYQLPWQ
jgi:hypothetical protein